MQTGIDIAELVDRLGSAKGVIKEDAAWTALRPLGSAVLPFLIDALPGTRRWQGREAIVRYALKFARTDPLAVVLARQALNDKSQWVRYRACELLACAISQDDLDRLKQLLSHPNQDTVADARAAIDAIQHNNHHYFIDREHTGRVRLNFDGSPLHAKS
jgi:hypothetical protein